MKSSLKWAMGLWVFFCVLGLGWGLTYSLIPGPKAHVTRVPAGTQLIEEKRAHLLVFLHPKCSCSEATLAELERVLPALKETSVAIVFNNPTRGAGWVQGRLWEKAQTLKGVKLIVDNESKETRLYGVRTSGHTVLVDAQGQVVFSGGLTASRGHEGESEGKTLLLSWREMRAKDTFFSKIFGCNLFKENT